MEILGWSVRDPEFLGFINPVLYPVFITREYPEFLGFNYPV